METIKARVDRVRYHSDDTGFTILSMKPRQGKTFTMRCTAADISEGVTITASGAWENDRKYGLQFVANSLEQSLPTTANGIAKYLTSGYIEGIGAKSAKRLVDAYGNRLWGILNNNPKRLYEVQGIRKSQIDSLISSWELQKNNNEAMVFLSKYDVGAGTAMRIIRKYGKDTIRTVKENPYVLADEVDGIGFRKADDIALGMGYSKDGSHRLRAGILFTLKDNATAAGHCYLNAGALANECASLLGVESWKISSELDSLVDGGEAIDNDHAIYLPKLFYAETYVASRLVSLAEAECKPISVSGNLGGEGGITYDEIQMDAIRKAMSSKVMVLTGGPGTGKTTTTNGIIAAWEEAGMKILLAAPTGRAAKRMTEATGKEASTIHRLLGAGQGENGSFFYNEAMPLEGDALIVDEVSMIDIELMRFLLAALPSGMRLVLVGDVDQLPSVGPGNMLRDVIDSGVIPVVRLTRIFRQAMNSKIVTNAHRINQGLMPEIDNTAKSDFFFMSEEDTAKVEDDVRRLVTERLPKYYHVGVSDIQVLSPMRKSNNGVWQLNSDLQEDINPNGNAVRFGSRLYRQGDRVMQTRNDYGKGVFNGDMGYITIADTDTDTLYVDFGNGGTVEYKKKDLVDLQLSYATTIHKSQGSEYPVVVIPLTTQFTIMLQRNLIYTAVTRAKKACVIVGQKKALAMAVRNKNIQKRNTLLKERLISESRKWQPCLANS